MSIYLTPSQLPELGGLSRKQRRFVWRQCVHPLLLRARVRIVGFAVFVACGLLGWWLGRFTGLGMWGSAVGAGLLVGVGCYLHDMVWASRYGPQITEFIESHAAEIQTMA